MQRKSEAEIKCNNECFYLLFYTITNEKLISKNFPLSFISTFCIENGNSEK